MSIFIISIIIMIFACLPANASEPWTMTKCIDYATEHNHELRLQTIAMNDYRADRTKAIGAFLPQVEGSVSGGYTFGRAINPSTNIYTDVSTLNNRYSLSAYLPLFDGFQNYYELRMAKANVIMGKHALEVKKDNVAMQVMKAFLDVLYYKETVKLAQEKLLESRQLVEQTRVMLEVGTKGEADLAQTEATMSADDYELTRQQGLFETALLALKAEMNYPVGDTLEIGQYDAQTVIMGDASHRVEEAEWSVKSARFALKASKGGLMPTLTLNGGIGTEYSRDLGTANVKSFSNQFRNNVGEYVSASISIPLFNRMTTLTNIRKQKNALNRAQEKLDNERTTLLRLRAETALDCQNSRMSIVKMESKVASDSIASRVTLRKYEEGLASSIDVQTTSVTLLQSRVQLLQSRLTLAYKERMLEYYLH